MSEREMHQQDLEVIHVVKENHEARKQALRMMPVESCAVFPNEETVEDRVRVLKNKVMPVLAWAAGGLCFLIGMSNGLCGVEMGVGGGLLCAAGCGLAIHRRWGQRYV